jgi:single stranded DNA-binding protein
MDYQKIAACLIGNVTKDAIVKKAKESGNTYGDFHLAVRNRQGETHFFPIRCFAKLAEGLTAVKKGAKVFVEGELEISSFASEEGGKRIMFRVIANTYRILGTGHRAEASEAAAESKHVQADPLL